MNLNIAIIIFGVAISLVPSFKMIRDRKFAWYNLSMAVLGICLIVLSIINDSRNTSTQMEKDSKIASLQVGMDSANTRLLDIVKNDSIFLKNLNDSGFNRKGNSVVTLNNQDYSTTNYYNNRTNSTLSYKLPETKVPITDELNFNFKIVGSKLSIAPKEGVWLNPYFQFESRLLTQNKNITDESEIPIEEYNGIQEINIGKSKIRVCTVFQLKRPIVYNNPLVLDISSDLNQIIIFGEYGNATKNYIYQRGKVSWFPIVRM